MSKILLVDEDAQSRTTVQSYFQTRGFDVVATENGSDVLARFHEERPDAVLLSKELASGDGFAVCRSLRNHPDPDKARVAVMFVSGPSELTDRLAAFESGADDFVQKPTAMEEIFVRVQALLRRSKAGATLDVITAADVRMDRVRHRVTRGGEEIPLTLTEYNLLEYLLKNKNTALSRKDILKAVWGGTVDGFTNIVDVYVNYLRKKIEKPESKRLVKTVRGIGYMLEE